MSDPRDVIPCVSNRMSFGRDDRSVDWWVCRGRDEYSEPAGTWEEWVKFAKAILRAEEEAERE